MLRCPRTGEGLRLEGRSLINASGTASYRIRDDGIPLFAEDFCSPDAAKQQGHYDEIADAYTANLGYPHTQEYMGYLDGILREEVGGAQLGVCGELCCGTGEAFDLFADFIESGIGVDVSSSMLAKARRAFADSRFTFVQGDATRLPLENSVFDRVFMLGGIHHVPDRVALFNEVFRVLKPGGVFVFREPVSDFWLWKVLRTLIYRLSPMLDHKTERPLVYEETVPVLASAGFTEVTWRTCGFLGFCLFMNSDVLFVNRFFRFVPGIRHLTRAFAWFDDWCTRRALLRRAGLQVVGTAHKPFRS
jgi:SAM-dependent methyltransferase